MEQSAEGEATVSGCFQCGGVFVDNVAGQLLVQGSFPPAFRALVETLDREGRSRQGGDGAFRARDVKGSQRLLCPFCQEPLTPVSIEGEIEVDLCHAHGTFFDAMEVRAHQFARAEVAARAQAKAAQHHAQTQAMAEGFRQALHQPSDERMRRRLQNDPLAQVFSKVLFHLFKGS